MRGVAHPRGEIATALTCVLQGFCQFALGSARRLYDQLYDPWRFSGGARVVIYSVHLSFLRQLLCTKADSSLTTSTLRLPQPRSSNACADVPRTRSSSPLRINAASVSITFWFMNALTLQIFVHRVGDHRDYLRSPLEIGHWRSVLFSVPLPSNHFHVMQFLH